MGFGDEAFLHRFLLRLSDTLRPLANPLDVQAAAARLLGEELRASRALYYTVESDADGYVTAVEREFYAEPAMPSVVGRHSHTAFGAALVPDLRCGRTLVADNVEQLAALQPAEIQRFLALQVRAFIVVPLVKDGNYMAGMVVQSATPRVWTPAEVSLVEATAQRTWDAVERARAEAEVIASEKKYRLLFETVDEGFCIIEVLFDENGQAVDYVFLETNPAFATQTGWENVIGKRVRELVPQHEKFWFETYGEVVRTGQARRFEHRADAMGRWYDVYAFRYGGPGERKVAVAFKDIMERKRTDESLRESNERQSFLLKLSDTLRAQNSAAAIGAATTRLLGKHLKVDRCYICHFSQVSNRARVELEYHRPDLPSVEGEYRFADFPESIHRLATEPLISADVAADPTLSELDKRSLLAMRLAAVIATPLRRGEGDTIWALTVATTTPRKWLPSELYLLEETSERVWSAMERTRAAASIRESKAALQQNEVWLAAQKEAFQSAMNGASLDISLAILVRTAIAQAKDECQCAFYIASPDGKTLHHVTGMSAEYAATVGGVPISMESLACGLAVARGEPVITPDVLADPSWHAWTWLAEKFGYRGCWSFPVEAASGRLVGSFTMYFPEPREITPHYREIAAALTPTAAIIISRYQAETALRASEEKYRSLFVSMTQGFSICEMIRDEDGNAIDYRMLEHNPAFERLIGVPVEEVVGRTVLEVFPETERTWIERFDQSIRRNQPLQFDHPFAPIGRWFGVTVHPRGSDRFTVFYEDITERKEAERALAGRQRRQGFLLGFSDALRTEIDEQAIGDRAVRLLAAELDLDLCYTVIQQAAADRSDVTHQFRRGDLPPLAEGYRLSDFPEVFRQTQRQTLVFSDIAHDSRLSPDERGNLAALRFGALLAAPVQLGPGDPIWVLGAASIRPRIWTSDEIALVEEAAERTVAVIARARAEVELRTSESKFRAVFVSMTEGFCLMELVLTGRKVTDVNFLMVNPAFEQQTGLHEVLGTGLRQLLPTFERYWTEIFTRVYETGEPVHTDDYVRDLDRWFSAVFTRVGGPGSTLVSVVFNDITERKRSEAALEESAERLRQADERKNHFLATLGHELRNPLAAVRGSLALLSSPKAKPESRERALAAALGQSAHMERLIDDLLDIARIVAGRMQVRKEPMVLQEAVHGAMETLHDRIEASGFNLNLDLPAEPLRLEADKVRLIQVFVNLLGNSLKYGGESRRIDVVARRENESLVVRVRDYGLGIAPDILGRIFEPFVQAKAGLTLQEGLGLGLAVVREVVRRHDGEVQAFSAGENQGSEFVVRLPGMKEDSP